MIESPPVGSMRHYLDALCAVNEPRFAFRATNRDQWSDWRAQLDATLRDLLVLPADEQPPIAPNISERIDTGPYIQETLSFASEGTYRVPAYLLRPKHPPPDREGAAVLCLHGHGRGMDDVAGIAPTLKERQRSIRALHYDYGHELALRGYTVLIPNARAMGASTPRAIWIAPGR